MNGFDLALVVALLIFTAIGAWRGFVREVLSLLTWIAGGVVAWLFADRVAGLFERMTDEPALRQVLAFILLFVAVVIIGTVAALLINKFILSKEAFRLPNRILGGLLGLARGIVIVVIVFLLAGLTSVPQRSWWHESFLAPYFARLAVYASGYIPRDVARHIRYG